METCPQKNCRPHKTTACRNGQALPGRYSADGMRPSRHRLKSSAASHATSRSLRWTRLPFRMRHSSRKRRGLWPATYTHQIPGWIGQQKCRPRDSDLGLTSFRVELPPTPSPALIETGTLAVNPNIRKELIPVGRFGTEEEVAETALLLASNGYIQDSTRPRHNRRPTRARSSRNGVLKPASTAGRRYPPSHPAMMPG